MTDSQRQRQRQRRRRNHPHGATSSETNGSSSNTRSKQRARTVTNTLLVLCCWGGSAIFFTWKNGTDFYMYSNKHTGSNHGTKPTAESRNITPTEFNIRKPDHDTEQEFIRSMKNSMAACLLVMDDNHFLIEWLAYHYHVLPLRHLIVAVDPRSRTNPSHILDRWRTKSANHNNNSSSDLMMNITVWWNDKDYGTDEHEWNEAKTWVSKRFAKDKPSDDLIQHRTRQRLFYYHCMQDHKRAGREYTLLTDSDEFLTVHNINSNNSILGNGLDPSITRSEPPKIAEAGSVLKLLQHERRLHPQNNITSSPCVQIPRLRFGAVESNLTRTLIFQSRSTLNSDLTPMDFNNNDNNADWNVSHFATLRWHVHANEQNYVLNRISKVIVDLSRIEWQFLQPVSSIHRPVEQYCKKRRLHIRAHQQKWLIHHYLGTWEQFSYRDDSRAANERSRLMYNKAATVNEGRSAAATFWLDGFVHNVGILNARYLLQGAGIVEPESSSRSGFS